MPCHIWDGRIFGTRRIQAQRHFTADLHSAAEGESSALLHTVTHSDSHARTLTARRVSLALTPIVKTRSNVLCTLHSWSDSRVPAAAPICHLRVRPHALSLTSCFISLSARSDEAMRLNPHAPSGSAQIQPPRRGMSVLHVREHDAPTTARSPPAKLRTHCAPQKKEPRTPPYPR